MQTNSKFIEIIRENDGLIYKVAKLYSNSIEDEQDLYQDIVYQLCKSFSSFRGESKITTWMYRIALNTSIRYLNKSKKKVLQIPMDDSLLNRPDINDDSEQKRHNILFAKIRTLNDIEKGLILLYLEGKSYEEIAAITGFTPTNIGTRLGRIRHKIKLNTKLNN